jgi:hemolysin III
MSSHYGSSTLLGVTQRFSSLIKEPINAITHGFGAIMALVFTVFLAWRSSGHWAFLVFGVSMIVLYTASTLHHGVRSSARIEEGLRRFDHAAIYALIAGTYTPMLWLALSGEARVWWLVGIWSIALFGIVMKAVTRPPEWFSLTLYVLMGWLSVFLLPTLVSSLPALALAFLIAGGLSYSVGVPFYALGARVLRRGWWTAHEIWHLFVLAGSIAHFAMVMSL